MKKILFSNRVPRNLRVEILRYTLTSTHDLYLNPCDRHTRCNLLSHGVIRPNLTRSKNSMTPLLEMTEQIVTMPHVTSYKNGETSNHQLK